MFQRRRRIKPVALDPTTGEPISPRPFIGMALLAAAFFLYAASFALVPWWVCVIGLACWVLMMLVGLVWWTHRPRQLPWLGVAALALWLVITVGGGIAFGWHGTLNGG